MDRDWEKQRLEWARELKDAHPAVLADYTVEEVMFIWLDHSHEMCAGWLSHESMDDEQTARVFSWYTKIDGRLAKFLEMPEDD